MIFLITKDAFKDSSIDEITHDEYLHNVLVLYPHYPIEKDINTEKYIPNSILRLEKFYDLQDKFKVIPNCKTNSYCLRYGTINLGTNSNPQPVNIGTIVPP